ncbi:MAG: hypothetical protein QW035_02705 [Candidatus Anstonellales archaeon]
MKENAVKGPKLEVVKLAEQVKNMRFLSPSAVFKYYKVEPEQPPQKLERKVLGVCKCDENGVHAVMELGEAEAYLLSRSPFLLNQYAALMVEVKNEEVYVPLNPMHIYKKKISENLYMRLPMYELSHDPVNGNELVKCDPSKVLVPATEKSPGNAEFFLAIPVEVAHDVLKALVS